MTGSPEQILPIFKELNALFQENKKFWADSPVYYIYLLHGLLTDLNLTKRYADMPYFLQELQQVAPNADSLHNLKQHLIYFHQIRFFISQNQFKKALVLAQEYEVLFPANKVTVPPNAAAAMQFRLAVVYFGVQHYSKSLGLVNAILNASGTFISSQLYVLGRLLHLLIHLELHNEDYLHYEIKSVERKLKTGKKLFTLERITLQFLKRWVNNQDRTKALQYYANALADLEKNDFENQLLQQFPFRSWVKAHLEKTPLLGVA